MRRKFLPTKEDIPVKRAKAPFEPITKILRKGYHAVIICGVEKSRKGEEQHHAGSSLTISKTKRG